MIRPFTLITMLLAAGAGAYLFAVKHRAQVLDDQLATVAQNSRLDAQRIRVLQAQWALEIDPTRVAQLAAQFTSLQPMQPAQLVTLANLRSVLPAPGSPAPGENAQSGTFAAPELSSGPVVAQAGAELPLPPDPPPDLPPAKPPATAPARLVKTPIPVRVPRPVSHSALYLAAAHPAVPPPRPLYAAPVVRPLYASVHAEPVSDQFVPVKAVAPPPAGDQNNGSALGMAADLPPPQPLAMNGSGN